MLRRVLLYLVASIALTPIRAYADAATGTYLWCVQNGPGTDVNGCGCDAPPFITVREAVAAAEAVPNLADMSRPDHVICMFGDAPIPDDIVLDNTTGLLGSQVTLLFEPGISQVFCPPETSPNPGGITVLGNGSFELVVRSMQFDGSACAGTRPMVFASNADVHFESALVTNTLAPLVAGTGPGNWSFATSRFQGGTTPFVSGDGADVGIEAVELSNYEVDGSPLVDTGTTGGSFGLSSSGLFGNVVRGSQPLVRTTNVSLHHSVISANVVVDAPMVEATLIGPAPIVRLTKSVLSRNVLAGTTATVEPAQPPVGQGFGHPPGDLCLPFGAGGTPYFGRDIPQVSSERSNQSLFRLIADLGNRRRVAHFASNFIVENETGPDGSVLEIVSPMQRLETSFVHNTVANLDGHLIQEDGGGVVWLASIRNLLDHTVTLGGGTGLAHVEASLDLEEKGADWTTSMEQSEGIIGPRLPSRIAGSSFTELQTVADCERVLANCPNVGDCSTLQDGQVDLACSLDVAFRYLPADDISPIDWPWQPAWFEDDYLSALPGATGIRCGAKEIPFDSVNFPSFGGDGDGWTTLLDCDNEDPEVVPALPEYDGYNSEFCEFIDDDCYECPEGSIPWEGDDDDSAVDDDDVGDDDDSAGGDDDVGDDDDSFESYEDACMRSGCGVAYDCSEGAAAFLPWAAPLVWLRRRRTQRGSAEAPRR